MLVKETFDNGLSSGGQPLRVLEINISSKELGSILQGKSIIALEAGFDEVVEIRVKLDDTATIST